MPQAVTFNTIDAVINIFSHHKVRRHFHICDQYIVTLSIREKYLGFSKTSHVDSLERLSIKIHTYKNIYSRENNMKMKYHNEFVQNLLWVI